MRVLLTGGAGRVGKAVVTLLLSRGCDVTVVGRSADVQMDGAVYHRCDINDYDHLTVLMRDHEAVAHLAAIPGPVGHPGREVFRVNDLGTFNVYEAAAEAGISRVVSASSINAFGFFFGDRSFPLPYLPVDEKLPGLATDAYSFSKQVMEKIADYFWERDGISGTSLRLPGVIPHDDVERRVGEMTADLRPQAEKLLAMPEGERTAKLKRLQDAYDAFRRSHRLDKVDNAGHGRLMRSESSADLSGRELRFMVQLVNFFAYIDDLDSAQAVEKSLSSDYEGSHALYVNSARNSCGVPCSELAKLFWPPVPEFRRRQNKDDCLCSIDRARELIGFDPVW